MCLIFVYIEYKFSSFLKYCKPILTFVVSKSNINDKRISLASEDQSLTQNEELGMVNPTPRAAFITTSFILSAGLCGRIDVSIFFCP